MYMFILTDVDDDDDDDGCCVYMMMCMMSMHVGVRAGAYACSCPVVQHRALPHSDESLRVGIIGSLVSTSAGVHRSQLTTYTLVELFVNSLRETCGRLLSTHRPSLGIIGIDAAHSPSLATHDIYAR